MCNTKNPQGNFDVSGNKTILNFQTEFLGIVGVRKNFYLHCIKKKLIY